MKFFNRFRHNLIGGKGFSKYIMYAIGEIILVVLGILIALYINNWNNQRQLSKDNALLQDKVYKQMTRDLEDLNEFSEDLDQLNQIYLKTLGREYNGTEMETGAIIGTLLFEVNTVDLNQQVVEWIDNADLDDSKAAEELLSINSSYKRYLKYIENIEKVIFEKLASNLEEIEKSQDWYIELVTDFKCQLECREYLLKDQAHKSRIASLRLLYAESYADIIIGFRDDLKRWLESLEKVMADKNLETS